MENWQMVVLDTDISAVILGEYLRNSRLGNKIKQVRGTHAKRFLHEYKHDVEKTIEYLLNDDYERKLVMYGNGCYHHYTYGLCKHADRFSDNYAYIHFDHHPDYVHFYEERRLSCGSFVERIVSTGDTKASTALFIGSRATKPLKILGIPLPIPVTAFDHIVEEDLMMQGMTLLGKKLSKLPRDVYLSFDLDVMAKSEIQTDFSRGSLKSSTLMEIIGTIKNTKKIIGADILGFSGTKLDTRSAELYMKIAESLLEA